MNNIINELDNLIKFKYSNINEYIDEIKKKENINLKWVLYDKPNVLNDYKKAYKLKLEIFNLKEMLKKKEINEYNNIDLLKEINSLIYEKIYNYNNVIKDLMNDIEFCNKKYFRDEYIYTINLYGYLKIFFGRLGFDMEQFSLNNITNEINIIEVSLDYPISDLDIEMYKNNNINLSQNNNLLSYDIINELKEGLKVKQTRKISKNDMDGIYLVNFNVLYGKINGVSVNNSLIYRYIKYRDILFF